MTTTAIHTCPRNTPWCVQHTTLEDGAAFCRGETAYVLAEGERSQATVSVHHLDGEPTLILIDGDAYTASQAELFARTIMQAVEVVRTTA